MVFNGARWGLVGGLLFVACEDPGIEMSAEPCGLSARWEVAEDRVGGACSPDRLPEQDLVIDIVRRENEDSQAFFRFDVIRGGERLEKCSGIVSDDGCRAEITCSGNLEGNPNQASFQIEVEEKVLSGSEILTLQGGELCQAQFALSGEMVASTKPEVSPTQ